LIIATAGHVDHGKTALVRNLTGIQTDRLAEEQRRGLSINLGYAYQQLPDGKALGFIDVPGHRRFINTMISGVSGIDLGMLVVAADDGPMPQTLEHIEIMRLLGVRDYVLVISKCDRSDQQRISQVRREAAALLPDDTAIYLISNTTGDGIFELRNALEQRAIKLTQRTPEGHFRMSIDRSFNLQGQGLIITGTVSSGRVAVGQTILLQPQEIALRVRGIHSQDVSAKEGFVGERCALNVSGDVHKDDIERGDWVVGKSSIGTTSRIDVRIRLLPSNGFALKHLSTIKLHIGAKHLEASLVFLHEGDKPMTRLCPGESTLAQIRTHRPIHCCHGDRFLLRDYGETVTLGGGVVLDPNGPKRHRSSPTRLGFLIAQQQKDMANAIRHIFLDETYELDYRALRLAWNVNSEDTGQSIPEGIKRVLTDQGEYLITVAHWERLKQRSVDALRALHDAQPGDRGFPMADVMRGSFRPETQHYFKPIVESLIRASTVSLADGDLRLIGYELAPTEVKSDDWAQISLILDQYALHIPTLSQVQEECGLAQREVQRVLARAHKEQRAIKINGKRYATLPIMRQYAQPFLALPEDNSLLTLAEYRDDLKIGRNLALEVLEYFDSVRFTKREGNGRRVLNAAVAEKLFKV